MIKISYLDKKGQGDEKGNPYLYEQAQTMHQAEEIAKQMMEKGFLNVMIIDDGKENWESYKKWLKRSLELTDIAFEDETTTQEQKLALQQKAKTFQLCIQKMQEIEKTF
ncbi:MAG TPA: hypothetical protein IAB62_08720 [Candidatus Coprocola pullicola]|nr:hypothetical protein [Candidatus Coprocola pullicola]